jgi:prophage antirepressor-like protein
LCYNDKVELNKAMSTLQLFDFEGHQIDWGKDDQGNPICEARQLGKILGFSASYVPEVVSRIYPQFKFQSAMGKPGRPSWYLREPGIYQMIFESKSDIAQRFQCWVFEEVLPKLRADGGYIMPNATSEQIRALTGKVEYLEQRTRHRTFRSLCKEVSRYNLPPKVTSEESSQAFLKLYWGLLDSGANRSGHATLSQFEKVCPPELKLPWKDK